MIAKRLMDIYTKFLPRKIGKLLYFERRFAGQMFSDVLVGYELSGSVQHPVHACSMFQVCICAYGSLTYNMGLRIEYGSLMVNGGLAQIAHVERHCNFITI